MRNNKVLLEVIEDMKILYQYLYMDESHTVTVTNGIANLELSMDDHGNFKCRNMNFPELPPMNYNSEINLGTIEAIISQLRSVKPVLPYFESRWEEVKEICLSNVSLNMMKCGKL